MTYWDEIHSYVDETLHRHTNKDPLLILFGITNTLADIAKGQLFRSHSWEHLCYLTAKRVLMNSWISPTTPTLGAFKRELDYLFKLERLDAETSTHTQINSFSKKWRRYIEYTLSPQERDVILTPFRYEEKSKYPT